ncbi:MAG: hypothetical protein J5729_03810 [Bacteroidaceae bacterium]|nr:hypothetical protein [Bacteroidaceae bacterium]
MTTNLKKIIAAIVAFVAFVLLAITAVAMTVVTLRDYFDMEMAAIAEHMKWIIVICIIITALLSLGIYRLIVGKDFNGDNRNFVSKFIWGFMWNSGNGFGSKKKEEETDDTSEKDDSTPEDDEKKNKKGKGVESMISDISDVIDIFS